MLAEELLTLLPMAGSGEGSRPWPCCLLSSSWALCVGHLGTLMEGTEAGLLLNNKCGEWLGFQALPALTSSAE